VLRAIQTFAMVHFLVIGLSHALQPRAWAEFFVWLRGRGHPGVFVHGFLSLGFGSMIVAFHDVWSGPPLLLTVAGWLYLVKAALCLVAPRSQSWGLGRVSVERAWEFVVPGVLYVAMGGFLAYILWTGR
jgi:hypothetical protein